MFKALAVVLASAVFAGCMVGDAASNSDPDVDAMALARVQAFHTATPINTKPYASSLGAFDVNCFVSGDVADFRRVHPEQTGSGVAIQRGTVIIREVLDERGQPAKLTAMAKGPPGFDPSLGDWWFGVTDLDGTPLVVDGTLMIGRLTQCHDCHNTRSHDDFLFGVPAML